MKAQFALVAAVLAVVMIPAPAGATTYPRTCGSTTWKGDRFILKAHLISCSKGKRYGLDYLRKRKRPKGWSCTNGKQGESIRFICRKSGASFLAIVK